MFFDSFSMTQRNVERQARAPSLAPIAPILGATSGGRATAESARGLLVTLLGEFVRPGGGSAWTQTLIDAMETLGVQDKATRQVLARLDDRGWLHRTRDGRRTRWALTPTSEALLASGAERIYGFGHDRPDWDGRWLVLLASLGEGDEHRRYGLTTGLTWAGFGSLGQGTWISPWVDHEQPAVAVIDDLDVDGATTFVAELGHLGEGTDLAARAWDLDGTRRHYDEFLAATESVDPTATGADAVHHLTVLVHRWRRFPFLDPELPDALLPDDWPAGAAVERFTSLRSALRPAATEWWSRTDADYGAPATA